MCKPLRREFGTLFIVVGFLLLLVACGGSAGNGRSASAVIAESARVTVATYHNDNVRSGANTAETVLTPGNVNVVSFGKIATLPVEGYVYAQPLYVPNVQTTDGGTHNIVVVATQHDQVYAFDVGSSAVVWHTDFLNGDGSVSALSNDDLNCDDIVPEVGITSTPVIDRSSGTVYVLVRTKETSGGQISFYQRLHALDLTTGKDKQDPQTITNPTGQGAARFDPLINNQRPALLLANGQVYVAWSSHCDLGNYTGWMMSFDASSLKPTGSWASTASGSQGGIWMAGAGPSADASGDVYVAVGNGSNTAMMGGADYGMSVVRLHWPNNTSPAVVDYFAPFNFSSLNDEDLDLGASGALLLPDHNVVVISKAGTLYLLDTDALGHWQADGDTQIVKSISGVGGFSTPAYWNGTVYIGSAVSPLQAFGYDPGRETLTSSPTSKSAEIMGYPGSTPSISSNGASNGIVWIIRRVDTAVLDAFDASDLSHRLYSTQESPERDAGGLPVKFSVPTIADGMVFVGAQNQVSVYGLLH